MKIQNTPQQPEWKQILFGGPAALVVAAGLAVGIGFVPAFVSAQENSQGVEALTFTSPLDGGGNQDSYPAPTRNNGQGNGQDNGQGNNQAFLAEALEITVEELAAARDAARDTAAGRDDFSTQLAAQLGITADALQTAQDAARAAALAQAIEDGRISEEEAALREAQRTLQEAIDRTELVANALGISVEELEAARDAGTSIRDIANELGVDGETLRATIEEAYAGAVQQAVDDGVVTQEQADAILSEDGQNNTGRGNRDNRGNEGNGGNRPQRPEAPQDSNGNEETTTNAPANEGTNNEESGTVVATAVDSPAPIDAATTGNDTTVGTNNQDVAPQQRGNRDNRRQGNDGGEAAPTEAASIESTPAENNNSGNAAPADNGNEGGRNNRRGNEGGGNNGGGNDGGGNGRRNRGG